MANVIQPNETELDALTRDCAQRYAELTRAKPGGDRHGVRRTTGDTVVTVLLVVDLETRAFRIAPPSGWLGDHDEATTIELSGRDTEMDVRKKLAAGVPI